MENLAACVGPACSGRIEIDRKPKIEKDFPVPTKGKRGRASIHETSGLNSQAMTWWHLLLLWFIANGALVLHYRRDLLRLWREPVFRYPILIFESDDWGAGPVEAQATALNRLVDVLTRHTDCNGRHPVMTLALVLAVPDGPAIRRDRRYHRRLLDDPMFAPVLDAIERGRSVGVFSLQLHGLEHYWPAALMASTDPAVRAWLVNDSPATTEALPPPLQSRWVDASVLPSRPLDRTDVFRATAEEADLFERIFGHRPRVAVPPTFVWTEAVEAAWASQGVEIVVTPGLRSACRNARGLPDCDSGPLRNGQGGAGVTYVVRDDYFEPERGHRAEQTLEVLRRKWREGRPCLLETHRSNFMGDPVSSGQHMEEIGRLLGLARARYPALLFMSTEELGNAFRYSDQAWIEQRLFQRMAAWAARLRAQGPFWKAARLTGLAWPLRLVPLMARADAR